MSFKKMATNLNIIHYISIFYIAFFAKSIKKNCFFDGSCGICNLKLQQLPVTGTVIVYR